jgi:hypothetical protein
MGISVNINKYELLLTWISSTLFHSMNDRNNFIVNMDILKIDRRSLFEFMIILNKIFQSMILLFIYESSLSFSLCHLIKTFFECIMLVTREEKKRKRKRKLNNTPFNHSLDFPRLTYISRERDVSSCLVITLSLFLYFSSGTL